MRIRFLIFLFLAACNFRPNTDIPDVNMGRAYRFEPWDVEEYINAAWWKQFNDPKLDQLIELAFKNNQNLQVATARVLEFYSQYRIVFSQFYPQIGAVGNIDRIKLSEDVNFQPLIPGVPRINTLYALLFNLSYEIDFWGRIRNATSAAKAVYLGEINARRNVVLGLLSSVAVSYITLKQAHNQLKISRLTYESRFESYRIAVLRYEGGLVSQLEVKQAESEALEAEVQIQNFEVLIAQQENLLHNLIGEAPGPIDKGKDLVDLNLPKAIPVGIPSDILVNRPDIMQAEELIRAANADVGVARAAFFPTITLTGLNGKRSTETKDFLRSSATLWDLGMQAAQPLFTGFRLTNQLSESEAVLMQALHSYHQIVLTALQEVSDSLIAHEKAKERLRIQTEQVKALERYLELAQLRYFNGQNDYLTVIDAQTSLFRTQLLQALNESDVFITLVSLYKALGQGWVVEEDSRCTVAYEVEEKNEIAPKKEHIQAIVGPVDSISK